MNTQNSIIAGSCVATLVLGLCIFYDYKRRKSPGYKRHVNERRQRAFEAEKAARKRERMQYPDINNKQAVQDYFLKEVELAEGLLGKGDIDNGVIHMGNAVALCHKPEELLSVLEQTMAPYVYPKVVQRFRYVEQVLKEDLTPG